MMRIVVLFLLISAFTSGGRGVYEFTMNSIDGKPTSLGEFLGKVTMIVNVASPGIAGLAARHKQFG